MSTQIPPVTASETRPAPAERAHTLERIEIAKPDKVEPAVLPPGAEAPAQGQLLVRFDEEAGRFVQTLTDASSEETIWRYPREAQLAYSRAVMAYLRALASK